MAKAFHGDGCGANFRTRNHARRRDNLADKKTRPTARVKSLWSANKKLHHPSARFRARLVRESFGLQAEDRATIPARPSNPSVLNCLVHRTASRPPRSDIQPADNHSAKPTVLRRRTMDQATNSNRPSSPPVREHRERRERRSLRSDNPWVDNRPAGRAGRTPGLASMADILASAARRLIPAVHRRVLELAYSLARHHRSYSRIPRGDLRLKVRVSCA
jgi:hypothetical protein